MSDQDPPTVGERIRYLREAKGLTREEFAREIQLAGGKADRHLVTRWENNEARPSAANQRPFVRAITPVGTYYPSGANSAVQIVAFATDTTRMEWDHVRESVDTWIATRANRSSILRPGPNGPTSDPYPES